MSNGVKVFRVTGYYIKIKKKIPVVFECRATSEENALEKAYSEIGSRHRVKRDRIFIEKDGGINEISVEEAREPEIAELDSEDFVIYR